MFDKLKADSKNYRGTSRSERLQQALLPDYVKVDERSLSALISFASRFAGLLPFYNNENEIVKNWAPFFDKDISVFLSQISTFNIGDFDDELQLILKNWERLGENQTSKWRAR
jgi:hypothetical protein